MPLGPQPPQLETDAEGLRGELQPGACDVFFSTGARLPFVTQPPQDDSGLAGAGELQLDAGRRVLAGSGLGAVRLIEAIGVPRYPSPRC